MREELLAALLSLVGLTITFAVFFAGISLGFFAFCQWQGMEFNVWAPVALTVAFIYAKALIKAGRQHGD